VVGRGQSGNEGDEDGPDGQQDGGGMDSAGRKRGLEREATKIVFTPVVKKKPRETVGPLLTGQ